MQKKITLNPVTITYRLEASFKVAVFYVTYKLNGIASIYNLKQFWPMNTPFNLDIFLMNIRSVYRSYIIKNIYSYIHTYIVYTVYSS